MTISDGGRFGKAPAVLEHVPRRAAGTVIVTDKTGIIDEFETHQCIHCQCHFKVQPGSGIKRGFCLNCNAVTCGNSQCDPCVPYEKKMEIEEGRNPDLSQFKGAHIL